jgi:hypothetical protein
MGTPVPSAFAVQLWDGSGPLTMAPTAADQGLSRHAVRTAASTNLSVVKNAPGNLYEIDFYNNAAYDVFFKLYDLTANPTLASDVPRWTIQVPTKSGFSRSYPNGLFFPTGISRAVVKLIADTDTTVVAVDDLIGHLLYV